MELRDAVAQPAAGAAHLQEREVDDNVRGGVQCERSGGGQQQGQRLQIRVAI